MAQMTGNFCARRIGVPAAAMRWGWTTGCLALSIAAAPGAAFAQQAVEPLLNTIVLPDFSRDRNVSVAETPRPDYDALPIYVGLFQVYPNVTATTLANSNVFYSDLNKHSDLVETIQPTLYAQSDWDKHSLSIYGTDQVKEYAHYRILSKNFWFLQSNGTLEIGDQFSLKGFLQAGHFVENPYSSALQSNFAALSEFNQAQESVQGIWQGGRVRVTAQLTHTDYSYLPLVSTTGSVTDQGGRDTYTNTQMLQAEYSLSPSLAAYGQLSVDQTRYPYDIALSQASRNSNGFQVIGGFSLDLAGIARGALGVGYLRRSYADTIFQSPSGLSIEGKIELFPTQQTTLKILAAHLIQDTTTGSAVAYYDTHAELDVDHEVRRNIIVTGKIYYGNQKFLDSSIRRNFVQANVGAKYLATRRFNIDCELGYSKSTVNEIQGGVPFGQFIASIALQYKI